jgi:hypothetical protein
MAAARGIASCSRVVGSALRYIPGSSLASRAASSVYESAAEFKDVLKYKTSNAFQKMKSKFSSAQSYQPVAPAPRQRASSPRASSVHDVIPPLSYGGGGGGGGSIYTKRIKHHKKHHKYTHKIS